MHLLMNHIWRMALVLVLALLVAPFSGVAATELPASGLTWKNVTVDGKKTAVFSLFRDSHDIMWIGTNNGLFFYDGVTLHPITSPLLDGTQVYAVTQYDNHLLLGTNNGLLSYDFRSGKVETLPSPKEIRALLLTDHTLLIGGLYGIASLDLRSNHLTDISDGLPHRSVYSLLRDSRGVIYAGTYDGLARREHPSGRWSEVKSAIPHLRPMKNLFVNALLESTDKGSIYVGTEGALYRYTPATDLWEAIPLLDNNNIKSLAADTDGHLLIGTDDGLFQLSGSDLRHFRHDSREELSLSDNEIWCVMADDDHNIWTGHERGISIASNSGAIRTIRLSTLAHTGEGNEIYEIFRDSRGDLWLGGTNGALRLLHNGSTEWYRHSASPGSLSHNRIRSIDEDSDHRIWLSTDGGLNRFNPERGDFDVFHVVDPQGQHNSNWVYSFEEEGDNYWIGSFLSGLHRVKKSKFDSPGATIVSDYSLNTDSKSLYGDTLSLTNDLVNDMIADPSGDLWILLFRDNLLSRYSPLHDTLVNYDIHALTGGYPTHLCRDRQGRIWCAFNGGAILFNRDGSHHIVRFPTASPDESTLAIGTVADDIWISTSSNVWSIDGKTLIPSLLPIPQKSYSALYEDSRSGRVLLGGIDEILEVDYRKLGHDSNYKAIKLLLHDKGNGQFDLSDPAGDSRGLRIPYGGNLRIVVSTLDYSPQAPQRFMYKIARSADDTADGWILMPEGSNTITLSDLRMGSYMILVKSVGDPGRPTAVPLSVAPPLWLSWWAVTIYILVAVAVIIAIIWYMRRRSIRAIHEKERQTALENVEKKLTFLSSISHDLKTPLSMILGPVSAMKERTRDADSRRALETVYDNAVRLNNMIHRTLELQHLDDADDSMLILSTFDAVEFCRSIFDAFKENNPDKHFLFHSTSTQIRIEADAVKFESVITNLLSNACKYSHSGATISLGISLHDTEVEITVADDGVGIPPADQPLVFQRMYRAPSTATLHEGTGLGLYLIRRYLELMKGNISLHSREGQGTSFVVTLPVSEKPLPAESREETPTESNLPRILIVEDNPQISAFISDLLKEQYSIFTASNGRAGLAIAASVMPDLIIADEMMPIMSGMEMVKQLKQNPRLAAVPIIMLTAKSDPATEKESIRAGIEVFMQKPFEPAALIGRIHMLLKERAEIHEKARMQAIAEAEARPIEAESASEKQLAHIARVIEENISDPDLNVNLLCEKSGIPNKQLYRLIKKYLNISPLDYIRRVRLQKAAVLLGQKRFTVSEISYMVGFKTPSYFTKCFQNQYGVKPSQYESEESRLGAP